MTVTTEKADDDFDALESLASAEKELLKVCFTSSCDHLHAYQTIANVSLNHRMQRLIVF